MKHGSQEFPSEGEQKRYNILENAPECMMGQEKTNSVVKEAI